ncbi:D-glycero-beta-D-manno-heptose 1,7-bisphosphate 7-phosphatase [Candidatus Odyssella thessalonicensis]|uniref:D-glycero-beta-D-manno-heptose 1,7-bisphosphate 7-phosphatase n=1 Tax=Candidatus Odyssella thessalonicensis TaxID=84647 RepID=UPI000225AC38|nr:D-glycero-beta-D-manno-heptose 1,7-bisphosphate 7-phosphatase [Candidatus Odyssella thessalonicensis]
MRNRALFLDRDGIINHDYGYIATRERFHFIDGIFEVCRQALAKNYLIIVITNQSGIARGLFSLDDFHKLTAWMHDQFKEHSIAITQVYFCPHHPDGKLPEFSIICSCRKPKPGLFLKAAQEHQIDLNQSIMVGDKARDLIAAQAAGVGARVLMADHPCEAATHVISSHLHLIKLL